MEKTQHIKVLDANEETDRYSELISDPSVEVNTNETFVMKTGEVITVIKYTKTEINPPELKAPILGF